MRGWQGFAVGAMGLALLELVVSRQTANANAAGILTGVGTLVRKFLSPTVPAFGAAPQGVAGTAGQGAAAGGQAAINQMQPPPTTPSGNPLPPTRISSQ